MADNNNNGLIVSYITLRKLIGILGMLLPFACILGGSLLPEKPILDSISAYYHSNMRDILTGLLAGVSLFLLTYNGHDSKDRIISTLCGITGLGIAIFPCASRTDPLIAVGIFQITPPAAEYLHYGTSALFFILLGVNSFFLFTLGDRKNWTRRKSIRNIIYRTCGIVIFISLAILVILSNVLGEKLLESSWTLVFETVMLLAFGTSWLVKGETLMADKPNEKRFNLERMEESAALKGAAKPL